MTCVFAWQPCAVWFSTVHHRPWVLTVTAYEVFALLYQTPLLTVVSLPQWHRCLSVFGGLHLLWLESQRLGVQRKENSFGLLDSVCSLRLTVANVNICWQQPYDTICFKLVLPFILALIMKVSVMYTCCRYKQDRAPWRKIDDSNMWVLILTPALALDSLYFHLRHSFSQSGEISFCFISQSE